MVDTKIDKHYKDFEGEPEVQFISGLENGPKLILSIWEGGFLII